MKVIAIIPKYYDYLVSVVVEGLYKNDIEVIASEIGNNVKKKYSKKEIIKHSKDADYILIFSGKVRGNLPPKYPLLDKINKPNITAYIDSNEWTYSGFPEKNQIKKSLKDPKRRKGAKWINPIISSYCRWYFKRECYPEDKQRGIIPLLYATEEKNFGNYDYKKSIDIFCSFGQKNTGLRRAAISICQKLKDEGYKVLIKSGFAYEEYKKLISKSLICIDAWGGGDCNARIWEIFANKSCCFSQKYNILFPNSFKVGYNYVEYSTIEEFEEKLRFYLKNKEKCLEIAERGYLHLLKHHTSKERVKYMLDILKNDFKKQMKVQNKRYAIGKILYLNTILNSFRNNPRHICKYIREVLKELKN